MGLATGGAWTGSFLQHTVDGVDMWTAITTNTESPRHEIVNYLTTDGNCSYVNDMKKLIVSNAGYIEGFLTPNFEFVGTANNAATCIV